MNFAEKIGKGILAFLVGVLYAIWRLICRIWKTVVGRYVIVGVLLLLTLILFLLIYRPSHRMSVTLEAGEPLPDPVELIDAVDAEYLNADAFNPSVPGVYQLKIDTKDGKYHLKVKVKDTVAPMGTVRKLNWGLGTARPKAEDFFTEITDATEVTVTYLTENAYTAMDTYPVKLLLTDLGGNKTEYETTVTLVRDTTPPTVTKQELSGCIGYGIVYSAGVIATDDCCGELTVTWDSSEVDTNTPGEYPVYYTVTDASGNATQISSTIYIYEEEITPEMLYVRIDKILDEIMTPDMSKEARVRKVYDYVYSHIAYSGTSDKSDPIRAAYQALTTGDGDCYSYFALSKVFFDRLGLENLDIQRTTGLTEDRHYWNMVNIGTKDAPQWYYYDATHLNSADTGVSFSGALLTEKQISAYNKVRANFYTFDHTGYPAASTEEITKTPDLVPYY